MTPLVLSLFPGIGLLDMAFELEGFCIVRGPDLLWGGDIRSFHPPAEKFDGVIGGPPCQAHSRMANLVRAKGLQPAPDMIPEFLRCVQEAQPRWWLMENVEAAPVPKCPGYHVQSFLLNNRWLGEIQHRSRRWTWGADQPVRLVVDGLVALESAAWEPAVMAKGMRQVDVKLGSSGNPKRGRGVIRQRRLLSDACELQGLPADFLADAPFTLAGKQTVVGNGVPLPMGRAVARAVRRALRLEAVHAESV